MNGITYIENFLSEPKQLFNLLESTVSWDERMTSRKTASFGEAYNYSQISYPFRAFPQAIQTLVETIHATLGFEPNNCLINYYLDGKSKMGFHSDQTDILHEGTGVVIVSLGETRTLRFRNIHDHSIIHNFELPAGSLIYMSNDVQQEWQHAIPTSDTTEGRMSLTFRKLTHSQ